MMVFRRLHAARNFQKRHLDFLATAVDFDLVCEIGYYQGKGTPLTMKRLLSLDIASAATLQRRLRRLKRLSTIIQEKSKEDRRVIEFTLAPHLLKLFVRYGELLAMNGRSNGQPSHKQPK